MASILFKVPAFNSDGLLDILILFNINTNRVATLPFWAAVKIRLSQGRPLASSAILSSPSTISIYNFFYIQTKKCYIG